MLMKSGIVKIGDFGVSRVLSTTESLAKTVVGTPFYLSPEMINQQPYSFKYDIWSIGILLYEMCALSTPFYSANIRGIIDKILVGEYKPVPKHFGKHIPHLLSLLL